ncbi:LacI family DNA-binding transcriptional regulator [Rahnella victoriana]|uniref:LacI family DNA-binding transcriptional regulator n=1 Tax=Rahnella victoriana TaxID=1510570 RepID=A0ABS0DUA0_9GAMM|nr:LacI family DNA-binding transcriptional regulator [Rahnella victoriana]MBF7957454.1 LacI family DNA-binding transcriptional regulator [Rahnella victoriana]
MITMLDVAICAGVSKATVSRVLNGKDVVRKEIKERVYKAIKETGYRPNLLAQQMTTQKTSMIGLVITNEVYNGPYFSTLFYNAAKYCEQHNHRLIFADGKRTFEEEIYAIDFLVGMKCAGVMVYTKYLSACKLDKIVSSSPIPIIALNQKLENNAESSVFINHYLGCLKMMDFLYGMGHSEIAYISGKKNSRSNTARQTAYLEKMAEYGRAADNNMIAQGSWNMQSGYEAAKELINNNSVFTAILAGNDDMAFGVIKALKEAGKRVPEDISVAGFDNAKMGNFFSPTLTTLDVPLEEMFRRAVESILDVHQDEGFSELSGTLVIRESVRKIN